VLTRHLPQRIFSGQLPILAALASSILAPFLSQGQVPAANHASPTNSETFALPESVPDPIEPVNRAVWWFNGRLMADVVKPTSRVYRIAVPKPVRTGISNCGKNLCYPSRLINNLFQGNWRGARDETSRFLCNTTVGVGGFFDVATKWKIQKSEADFGQTLGQWGWQPRCYLILPILGPSNERDALGWAADTASNPLVYVSPYPFDLSEPVTSLAPYTYFNLMVRYNDLSDTVGEYVRFDQAEMDPYSEVQYAWTFARANRVARFQVKGIQDETSLETLESVFFTNQDPEFPGQGKTRSVLIPTTGRKLNFTVWLQPGQAPMVYIVPGLGSHRLTQTSLALAELVYQNGFSAVCVSSPFNFEFMENASTAALPAYLPVDGHDLEVALNEIDHRLKVLYPHRLGDKKALLGYSMGAFESLFISATGATNQPALIHFDRCVAINPPVRMIQGVDKLDEFYRAPLSWPRVERTDNIETTFLKVASLSKGTLTPQTSLPFNAIESKFLIGLTFRLALRDVIYSSQRRNNQGIVKETLSRSRRHAAYQEILQYSFRDYFEKFAVPYYETRGLVGPTAEALEKGDDLRTYEAGLHSNPNIRVIENQNDFLLSGEDLAWLHATFTPEQLTVFPEGGHLGNLSNPMVQKAILGGLAGLK
jgi:ABC-type transporter lipoprotein component MlaA